MDDATKLVLLDLLVLIEANRDIAMRVLMSEGTKESKVAILQQIEQQGEFYRKMQERISVL